MNYLNIITLEANRLLTIVLCGLALILWWSSPLFLKYKCRVRWYWFAMFCTLVAIIGTIGFSWWKPERGLLRTYYRSSYFSGESAKETPQKDRTINFSVSDFYDWDTFSGKPFSVKWEGNLYFPSDKHRPEILSSCLTVLKIDNTLIQTPPTSLDIGTPEGRKGLGRGWSYDGKSSRTQQTYVWSSDNRSDVYLGVNDITDMLLTFHAVAFDYPHSPIQQVDVFVNDVATATLPMKKNWEWATYTVSIPQETIEKGLDGIVWIQFRYSNAVQPSKILPGSSEARKLAIALDTIELTPVRPSGSIQKLAHSGFSQGFHRISLLVQSSGDSPSLYLRWNSEDSLNFSLISEDYLFPPEDDLSYHLPQKFQQERAILNILILFKCLTILLIASLLVIGVASYANVAGLQQFQRYIAHTIRTQWRSGLLHGFRVVATLKTVTFLGRYDVWIIAALRPFLFLAYFGLEKFFLYAWDDQHSYFAVAMGLIKLDPIVERFTFGFPVLLIPFIKIFNPQNFSEIVLPFSIFNAFILGTLGIYLVFQITNFLVKDRYTARIATLLYVIHPFFPLFAKTKWNQIYLHPVYWGDIVGWNMTSDQVSVVFMLLAVFLFLKSMSSRNGMILTGVVLGYAGLIRMPSLAILMPLLYLGVLHRISWKQYLLLFISMGVVLSPQLAYNWHFFGSPFTFGYTALKHIKQFWTPSLVPRQLATILWDHASLFVVFVTTFLIYVHRKIGGMLILWVLLFTLYYAGYEALYNDPIRFLLPIRPALCIGAAILLASGKDVIERIFLLAALFTMLMVSSYRTTLSLPSDMIPATFYGIGVLFVIIGMILRVRRIVLASLCLYIVCSLHLLKLSVLAWGMLAAVIFLINFAHLKWWGQFASYEPDKYGEIAR